MRALIRMRKNRLRIFSALAISLLAAFYFLQDRELTGAQRAGAPAARVVEVHDGDTVSVLLKGRREKVRLIGIDAPELGQRQWGRKAKRHLEELLDASGWTVTLEFDVEMRDKYGRLLAYLWTPDRRLLNLEMVKDGYAALFTFPPNVKYADSLREAQRSAREKGMGIWGSKGLKQMPGDYRREHPR